MGTDTDAFNNAGADADMGAFTDGHVACQVGTGREVYAIAQDPIMIDRRVGVDDHHRAKAAAGLHRGVGHDHRALPHCSTGTEPRARMQRCR